MMSAPHPPGGRESETSSTTQGGLPSRPSIGSTGAGASDPRWIEPVFGAGAATQSEQRQAEVAPGSEPRDAIGVGVAPEAVTPSAVSRPIAVTRINRLDEAISAEREAAVSALAALHGTFAAGALAALHETLAAERELAVARIIRFGAQRAAAAAEMAPAPGSAVVHTIRVEDVPDAASIWSAMSLLRRRNDGARRSIREGTGSALMLVPEGPDYFRRTGTELSVVRLPEARAVDKSRRGLVVNAFALLVATVGVVAYYGSDIWSASARQTPGAAGGMVHSASPAAAPTSNPAQGIAYFRKRADAGDAAAQYALGVLYAQGDTVAQDYPSAAAWFRKAAAGGIVNAQDLAALYERGLVTPQDFVVAAYWYRNAAERGVEAAMAMLALLYERGQGVEASAIDAYAWYRAAARRGDTVAGKRAAALFAKFDGPEKGRAVVRAAEIVDALHEPRAAPSGTAALIPGDWIGRTGIRESASTN